MPKRAVSLIVTCEHASNRMPPCYAGVAKRAGRQLNTHRGHDFGSRELSKLLSAELTAPLFAGKWSRLLIELNRSLHHPKLWSEFSESLPNETKLKLLNEYYFPYRNSVERWILNEKRLGRQVVHIGVHSFTPCLNGETRNADIGLLYDPHRPAELNLCRKWSEAISELQPELRVRRNYPYRGVADGFATYLRRQFKAAEYIGIELEVNQRFPLGPARKWRRLQRMLVASLRLALSRFSERRLGQG